MKGFELLHACAGVLLLASCMSFGAASNLFDGQQTPRVLHAATKRSDLYRRSMRITKKFEAEVSYVENENGWNGKPTFASQVKVSSKKPIMDLEEIEHHLQDVQCGEKKMKLNFVDASSARDAFHSCRGSDGSLIITSHEGCNAEGERTVFKVHDVSFADYGQNLELTTTKALWQDAFDSIDISFGHTTDDHLFRRHEVFAKVNGKRQVTYNPINGTNSTAIASFVLGSQHIGTTFPVESFVAGLKQVTQAPQIPDLPIEIGCKNCTTRGSLALSRGAFSIDTSQIDLIPKIFKGKDDGKHLRNVIKSGFFELAANGIGAHLDMFAKPKISGAYEVLLFEMPIMGFAIPGIGEAGAMFEPRIAMDFEISGGLDLSYGIDVFIPDNSKIFLNLSNIKTSAVNGFPGSTLTPLPIRTDATDIDINLGLAFKPTIPIGFSFANKLKATAFVSMSLPRLNAQLSTDIAAHCSNGNGTNTTPPLIPYISRPGNQTNSPSSQGPLVLVGANISTTIDVGLGAEFPFLPPPFALVNISANLFSKSMPLVTSCVSPEDAFKSIKGIIPPPPSSTYAYPTLADHRPLQYPRVAPR